MYRCYYYFTIRWRPVPDTEEPRRFAQAAPPEAEVLPEAEPYY